MTLAAPESLLLKHHILYEDLERIVLLGFSYGAAVVTGARSTWRTASSTSCSSTHSDRPGEAAHRLANNKPQDLADLLLQLA